MKLIDKHEGDKSFAALRSFMWHYKWRFMGTDLLRIASSAAIAFQPYFMGRFASSLDNKEQAFKFLMLFLVSGMVHGASWTGCDFIVARKIFPLFHEYKRIAFSSFWSEKYPTFVDKPSGKVGYYVNQFPNQIYSLYDSYHFGFLPIATAIPIYAVLFASLSWQSTAIYIAFILFTIFSLTWLSRIMTREQKKLTDLTSTNSGRVFDSYANFVNVFSFRAKSKEIKRNNVDIELVKTATAKTETILMSYWAVAATSIRFGLWSAIIFFSWYMYDSGQVAFATLVVSIAVLLDFTHIYWNFVHQLGSWKKTKADYEESYGFLFEDNNMVKDYYKETKNSVDNDSIAFNRFLTIDDLNFAYPDAPNNKILKNFSLTIAKNEKIGIVGKSGSGKSTFVKLLLGFYELGTDEFSSGIISVDGKPIKNTELSQLHAYVPQDTTLFQETIFYNIAYAKDGEATQEEVHDAARKAHISEFIESLPLGYQTMVGERGVKLSLGQRQRIAIARAFLKEAPLLILDEATSSLDSKTESYVQEAFEKLWGNKSVIAIAHRLSTLNNVDRIVVMSKGEIVEQGTKQELLELNGHFAELWNHQKKGMI